MLLMTQKWATQAGFESAVFPLAGLSFRLVSGAGSGVQLALKNISPSGASGQTG